MILIFLKLRTSWSKSLICDKNTPGTQPLSIYT